MSEHAKPLNMPAEGRDIVLGEVIKDLTERAETGKKKYGTFLKTFNARNALVDALQESYDQSMYLKQALMEFDDLRGMVLSSLWKSAEEKPTKEDTYPVILSVDGVKKYKSFVLWANNTWVYTSGGADVVAWFDIPTFEVD